MAENYSEITAYLKTNYSEEKEVAELDFWASHITQLDLLFSEKMSNFYEKINKALEELKRSRTSGATDLLKLYENLIELYENLLTILKRILFQTPNIKFVIQIYKNLQLSYEKISTRQIKDFQFSIHSSNFRVFLAKAKNITYSILHLKLQQIILAIEKNYEDLSRTDIKKLYPKIEAENYICKILKPILGYAKDSSYERDATDVFLSYLTDLYDSKESFMKI